MMRLRRLSFFSLFVLFISLVLLSLSAYLMFHRPLSSFVLPVRFIVGDPIGLEINDSALTFGRTPPGTTLYRKILINNTHVFSLNVRILINRTLADYVFTPRASFTLPPLASYEVPFILAVSSGTTAGNYSGDILFEFWK